MDVLPDISKPTLFLWKKKNPFYWKFQLLHIKKRKFRQKTCHKLFSNMNSDPKSFWGLINKLNKLRNDINIEEFNTQEFIQFYKNLNMASSSKNNEFHGNILKNLKLLVKNHTTNISDEELNLPLSGEEILKMVKCLKNGKASASNFISDLWNDLIRDCSDLKNHFICFNWRLGRRQEKYAYPKV